MERLFEAGALDVVFSPGYMKKTGPLFSSKSWQNLITRINSWISSSRKAPRWAYASTTRKEGSWRDPQLKWTALGHNEGEKGFPA